VLDLSKIEAGKLELNPQTVQLASLINDVISTAGQLAEQNKNRLVVDAQENLGALTVDPMRLRQILLNLLGNAIKFTDLGEIRLSVKMLGDGAPPHAQIAFEVIDSGVGMSPEQLQNLFDCFQQGDMSAKRRFRGTGLGLAVSMRLARMLGGSLSVTSTPGAGSTFRLVLPVGQPVDPVALPAADTESDVDRLPVGTPALVE
jgi:signal transduction histidine kinase